MYTIYPQNTPLKYAITTFLMAYLYSIRAKKTIVACYHHVFHGKSIQYTLVMYPRNIPL